MQVLCCCDPSNEVGSVPVLQGRAAGLEIRRWVDQDGKRGVAFASDHQPVSVLSKIPGFVADINVNTASEKTWEAEGKKKKKDKPKSKKKSGSPSRQPKLLNLPKPRRDKTRNK